MEVYQYTIASYWSVFSRIKYLQISMVYLALLHSQGGGACICHLVLDIFPGALEPQNTCGVIFSCHRGCLNNQHLVLQCIALQSCCPEKRQLWNVPINTPWHQVRCRNWVGGRDWGTAILLLMNHMPDVVLLGRCPRSDCTEKKIDGIHLFWILWSMDPQKQFTKLADESLHDCVISHHDFN